MSRFDITQAFQQAARPAAPAERTIEAITGDILEAQRKGGEAILTIGNCLIEAKSMLLHGEWLPWLNSKVGYSEKTAQNFMRLAREFSNPQALADLGATKALALLALPTEERERFLEDHNVIDMTTRQLEQAIKERDEAQKAAEQAKADAAVAEQARSKMEQDMVAAKGYLEAAREEADLASSRARALEEKLRMLQEKPVDVAVETVVDQDAIAKAQKEARAQAVAEMQAELDRAKEARDKADDKRRQAEASVETLKRSLEERAKTEKKAVLGADKDVAVETVVDQDAIAKAQKEARAQAVAEMQAELDRAKEARDKADDKRRQAEASVETLKRSLEERAKTEKKAVLGADKDLAQFELLFQQAQETANKMHGILLKVRSRDEDAAGRLVKALQALAEAVGRCAE